MLEGEAHKIAQRALQPAVWSHKLLIKFFKLKKKPYRIQKGQEMYSRVKESSADSQHPRRIPPFATQKICLKRKIQNEKACENRKFKVQ